jgi:hypothetical protein
MRRRVYMKYLSAIGLDPVSFKESAITLVEGSSQFVPDMLLYLCGYTAGRTDILPRLKFVGFYG